MIRRILIVAGLSACHAAYALDIDPLDPVPAKYEPEVKAALQRLVAANGTGNAWYIVREGIEAALDVDETTATAIGNAIVADLKDTSDLTKPQPPAVTNAPPTQPEPLQDAIDVSRARWASRNSFDLSRAPAVIPMASAALIDGGSKVRVAYDGPGGWWNSNTDALKFARGLVAWESGGQVYVAHYDWFRPGQTVKVTGNIGNGYVNPAPPRGTALYFAIASNNKNERTTFAAGGRW